MWEQIVAALSEIWYWTLDLLGIEAAPSWLGTALLVIGGLGALYILSHILGTFRGSGRGPSNYGVSGGYGDFGLHGPHGGYDPNEGYGEPPRPFRGVPSSFYTGSKRLVDFRVDPKMYDFSVPPVIGSLDKLKEPLNLDLEAAKVLHVPSISKSPRPFSMDWEKARELFVPGWFPADSKEEVE